MGEFRPGSEPGCNPNQKKPGHLNQKELCERIAYNNPNLFETHIQMVVREIVCFLTESLAAGHEVQIPQFGQFRFVTMRATGLPGKLNGHERKTYKRIMFKPSVLTTRRINKSNPDYPQDHIY
jgi:nucleoid DNA-binding protein